MMQRGGKNSGIILALVAAFTFLLIIGTFSSIFAQQTQIPTLQVCNQTEVTGYGEVIINSRKTTSSPIYNGTFRVKIDSPITTDVNGFAIGNLKIENLSMTDSEIQGVVQVISIDQVTSTGAATPMAFLSGRCRAEKLVGGRFWMMLVDNNRKKIKPGGLEKPPPPDIISFLVFDNTGKRVAYGTGPVVEGNIKIKESGN